MSTFFFANIISYFKQKSSQCEQISFINCDTIIISWRQSVMTGREGRQCEFLNDDFPYILEKSLACFLKDQWIPMSHKTLCLDFSSKLSLCHFPNNSDFFIFPRAISLYCMENALHFGFLESWIRTAHKMGLPASKWWHWFCSSPRDISSAEFLKYRNQSFLAVVCPRKMEYVSSTFPGCTFCEEHSEMIHTEGWTIVYMYIYIHYYYYY